MHQKRTYRDVELLESAKLYDLAEAILDAFEFEDRSHLFGFGDNLGDYWSCHQKYSYRPDLDQEPLFFRTKKTEQDVEKTKLSEVEIFRNPKDKMMFLFDYGDCWEFEVELRGFGKKELSGEYPRMLQKKGVSPEQYPEYDDEE